MDLATIKRLMKNTETFNMFLKSLILSMMILFRFFKKTYIVRNIVLLIPYWSF